MCGNNSTLVVDAGNTRVKWTLFSEDRVVDKWVGDKPEKERIGEPFSIAFASVRSAEHDKQLRCQLKELFPSACFHNIQSESQACGVINSYVEPHRLGVDRWLAAIAAYKAYGGPVVVIDAGTAIKVDFVSASGVHLGGYIVPSVELMASSLISQTAKIRYDAVEVSRPDKIPSSTADAVTSGCLEMALGFIERVHAQHCEAQWLVTGGGSQMLMDQLNMTYRLDEHLVAKGAKYVLDARLKGDK